MTVRHLFFGAVLLVSCKPAAAPVPVEPVTTRGELAGIPYLERVTGGARAEDRLPMIVVLHPMGGDPAGMVPLLSGYRGRARLVFPSGKPRGGMYFWFDSPRADGAAEEYVHEVDRLMALLKVLTNAHPTEGRPFVTGFSQGGTMTFALAATHPDAIAGAFPVSGLLPPSLYPSTTSSSKLPPVVAFHGAADLAVPIAAARASITALQGAGYTAELHEYPGLEHDTTDAEWNQVFERMELIQQ